MPPRATKDHDRDPQSHSLGALRVLVLRASRNERAAERAIFAGVRKSLCRSRVSVPEGIPVNECARRFSCG
jgi:hypothetical protein